MKPMTIAGLAKAAGVGVETVRYYQRRGLIEVPDRGVGYRHYDEATLRRLRFIKAAQGAGFTLDQIGELLSLDATEDRARARQLAEQQLLALDQKIATLMEARNGLRRLAESCRSGPGGPCPILTAFDHV